MSFLVEDEDKFIRKMGKGKNGKADLVKRKGKLYIRKTILLDNPLLLPKILNEIVILQYIRKKCRPYLLCYSNYRVDELDKQVVFYTDFIEGSVELQSYIVNRPNLDLNPRKFINIATSMLEGLSLLHSMGVAHKDIKPQNMLIRKEKEKYIISYIDFGSGCLNSENKQVQDFLETNPEKFIYEDCTNQYVGTPLYLSPFLLQNERDDIDFSILVKNDLWGCGLSLYSLAFGVLPYEVDMNDIREIPRLINFIRDKLKGTGFLQGNLNIQKSKTTYIEKELNNYKEKNKGKSDKEYEEEKKRILRKFGKYLRICIQIITLFLTEPDTKNVLEKIKKIIPPEDITSYTDDTALLKKIPYSVENKSPLYNTIITGPEKYLRKREKNMNLEQITKLRILRGVRHEPELGELVHESFKRGIGPYWERRKEQSLRNIKEGRDPNPFLK